MIPAENREDLVGLLGAFEAVEDRQNHMSPRRYTLVRLEMLRNSHRMHWAWVQSYRFRSCPEQTGERERPSLTYNRRCKKEKVIVDKTPLVKDIDK